MLRITICLNMPFAGVRNARSVAAVDAFDLRDCAAGTIRAPDTIAKRRENWRGDHTYARRVEWMRALAVARAGLGRADRIAAGRRALGSLLPHSRCLRRL